MAWFKRAKPGLTSQKKKDMPNGLWVKCEGCGEIIYKKQLAQNSYVCMKCDFHFRITGDDYIRLYLDEGSFKETDASLRSVDFLNFKDTKQYADRLKTVMKKTGLNDAVRIGYGKVGGRPVIFGVMDFAFIGGSMGSVVGEKVARAVDHALEKQLPLIIVSASGGARMMESIISLMHESQYALTSGSVSQRAPGRYSFLPRV